MKADKSILSAGIAVAVVLIGVGALVIANHTSDSGPMSGDMSGMRHMTQQSTDGVDKSSADYQAYSALKGEDYDRTFMANMITHHQGVVDMARLALTNAKHQEIKGMAQTIIAAQTKEIRDMQTWQESWGYQAATSGAMDHGTMGMMGDMQMMTDRLKSLTGDAFDKTFLSSMIMHHQAAINMAYPGQANAGHEEVKALTKVIVDVQSMEIAQMRQWQKDWDYQG